MPSAAKTVYAWASPFNVTPAVALTTVRVFVTSGAGFQFALPACDATTTTLPAPVKARFVPPERVAGPDSTANATGSPLDAAADSPTTFVATQTLPFVGKKAVIA